MENLNEWKDRTTTIDAWKVGTPTRKDWMRLRDGYAEQIRTAKMDLYAAQIMWAKTNEEIDKIEKQLNKTDAHGVIKEISDTPA